MFDHASVRPRVLHSSKSTKTNVTLEETKDEASESEEESARDLFASTIFGPTCDSIDVIARSVLLPKLSVGDWMYFQNMGAYTMAAASSFNGFSPSSIFYVCSVQPEYFEGIIKGISADDGVVDEKKMDD